MVTRVLGKPVSNAASAGHRKRTKRMRNIRSMCRDIAWWEVNEVQIPGNKIEPQGPLLDTLVERQLTEVNSGISDLKYLSSLIHDELNWWGKEHSLAKQVLEALDRIYTAVG
jgi:hypothetical protein